MSKIVKVFFIVASLGPALYASKEVACKCNNKTVTTPDCGVCGSEGGKMEKTQTGVSCFCENELKFREISCEEACAQNNGWSGEFVDQ
ncbi:hypothetical protein H0X06_02750 [Candidatus Dependentiae bacterium]|nr:hypothetical protein [Candidatus Dependentiae bacterium]